MLLNYPVVGLLLLLLCPCISNADASLSVTSPVDVWFPAGTYTTLQDIDVDAAGNVYVVDSGTTSGGSVVWKFSHSGTILGGPFQDPNTPMDAPYGIAVNNVAGLIYVADMQLTTGHPRLVIFTLSGTWVRSITIGASLNSIPRRLTTNADGTLAYIPVDQDLKVYIVPADGVTAITILDGTGGGSSGFGGPVAVAVDPLNAGRLYVATTAAIVVHVDIASNTILQVLPGVNDAGIADITFDYQDPNHDLYITNAFSSIVYQMVGITTSTIRTEYSANGMTTGGLAINSNHQLIVGDTESQNVWTFNPAQTTVSGDPQFVGFQQQSFQVHGASGEYFNLVTSPSFQLNSRFMYIASGSCSYNETECWTHPGTYVDQLGIMAPGVRVHVSAGPHSKGMHIMINDEMITPARQIYHIPIKKNNASSSSIDSKHIDIHYISIGHVMIITPLLTLEVHNSDLFLNLGFSLHSTYSKLLHAGHEKHLIKSPSDLITFYPDYPLHGLVGQTWRNARYNDNRMYQGDILDYMIDGNIFSNQFMYNLYQHQP